jgi:homoserine kinase type II
MADYTKLTANEIEVLAASYDLGKLDSITPMQGGQANSSFKISTGEGFFILSVCDEKNIQQIDYLTKILVYLEIKKFSTSRLVKTRNGDFFITRDDTPVYIKKYINGKVIKSLNPHMLVQVGEAMARLHCIPSLNILPGRFPYGLDSFEEIFEIDMQHPYVDWLKQKQKFLKQSIDPEMDRGFIHGDIFWDNLLFSKDRLIAMLDFEEACHYYKLYDIGMCAVGCCGKGGSFDMKKVGFLLDGYQQYYLLSQPEKQQLKIFMEYAAAAGSFWRFCQYNIKYPHHDMAQSYQELSSLADHIHEMDDKEFMDILT